MVKKSTMTALAGLICMLTVSGTASAYLDPGTGSMLLQLLVGGVAGIVVILKLYWQRVTSLFRRKKPEEEPAPTSPSQPDE